MPPVSDAERDLGRLVRLLGLLGSANDHEALAAARKAAAWVAERQTSWAELLDHLAMPPVLSVSVGASPTVPAESTPPPRPPQGPSGGPHTAWPQSRWVNPAGGCSPPPGYAGGVAALWQNTMRSATQGMSPAQAAAFANAGPPPGMFAPISLGSWREACFEILTSYDVVLRGSREREFVLTRLNSRTNKLTDKQEKWLRDIADRAGLTW